MLHWVPKDRRENADPWPNVVFSVLTGEKKDLGNIKMEGRAPR